MNNVTRWVWDGNTPLHECVTGQRIFGEPLPPIQPDDESLITWVFENGTFVPAAKITKNEQYTIVTDYLGTPVQMYDSQGKKIWECELDIYGKVRTFEGSSLKECPFRYQGQYEDGETGLYYNRFRYYSSEIGGYISQDPIRLNAGKFNLYSYVNSTISQLDLLGLECSINVGDSGHHVPAVRKAKDRPFEVSRSDKTRPTFHFKRDDPSGPAVLAGASEP